MIIAVPRVTFLPAGETFEFETGKLPYKGHGKPESLLDVAMNFGFHLEHACGNHLWNCIKYGTVKCNRERCWNLRLYSGSGNGTQSGNADAQCRLPPHRYKDLLGGDLDGTA